MRHRNAFQKNYAKKIEKGKFNKSLAIKGLITWINMNTPRLRKEGMLMYPTYSKAVKTQVAESNLDDILADINWKKV